MKKRIISLVLAVVLIISLPLECSAGAPNEPITGTCGTDLTWVLDPDTGTLTISGTGAMTNYQYDKSVWVSRKGQIKHVVIEEGVTSIGNYAFCYFTQLQSVTIPDTVTIIGEDAFYHCLGLTSINIPGSVVTIGVSAFNDCQNLTTVSLGYGVKTLGASCFRACTAVTSMVLPSSVTSLGYACLDLGENTELVILSEKVKDETDGITCKMMHTLPDVEVNSGYCAVHADLKKETNKLSDCESVSTYTCGKKGCGKTYTETIVKHSFVLSETVAPTCVASGYTLYRCENCTETKKENYTEPTGVHTYGDPVTVLPTCAEDGRGYDVCICTGCGAYSEKTNFTDPLRFEVDATGLESDHSYHDNEVNEWTVSCTEEEATELQITFSEETDLELEYDFLNILDANGDLVGRYTGTTLAGATVKVPTPSATLRMETERSNNSYGFKVTKVLATSHIWDGGVLTVPPTTEPGEMKYTCTRCGETYTVELSPTMLDYGSYNGINWSLSLDYVLTLSAGTSTEVPNAGTNGWGQYRDSVKAIVLEPGITAIAGPYLSSSGVFAAYGITSASIPNTVTYIGNYAFSGCKYLLSADLPDSVTYLGDDAFDGCSAMKTVKLPAQLTEIRSNSFTGCSSLTEISIPEGVASIGNGAFSQCSGLKKVVLPDSVKAFGSGAFSICQNLKTVELVSEEHTGTDDWYSIWLNCTFHGNEYANPLYPGHAELLFNGRKITEVKIPGTFTAVPDYAFAGCSGIETVMLPANLEKIGQYAFYDCGNLQEVVYVPSNNLREIRDYAFGGQTKLRSLTVPASVRLLGKRLLGSKCNIIIFEGNVPSIMTEAFASSYSSNYVTALYPASDPTWTDDVKLNYGAQHEVAWIGYDENGIVASGTAGENVAWTLNKNGMLRLSGTGEMPDYTVNSPDIPWSRYQDIIFSVEVGEGITGIGKSAFSNLSNLTQALLPSTLEEIGSYAFYQSGIRKITIPEKVTKIEEYAFNSCSGLTEISLPENLESIGDSAFKYCSELTEIRFPKTLKSIGGSAFEYCYKLNEITFRGSVPTIKNAAFSAVTATVYYPAEDPSWTADVRQNYYGTLTWVADETAHNYQPTVTEPTCTEQGYTTYTCVYCGDSYVDDYVPVLGHSYEHRCFEPTCMEKGFEAEVCTRCGDVINECSYVDELGHDVKDNVVAPTCVADGYTYHYCSRCDYTYTDTTVPATGEHTWQYYYTAKFSTCLDTGIEVYRCSVCGATEERGVDPLGHTYKEIVTAPTCSSGGYSTFVCARCGDNYAGSFTAPTGHDWDDGVLTKQPTCTETGLMQFTCETCRVVSDVIVPAKGHVVIVDQAVEASCDKPGLSAGSHCGICGEVLVARTEVTVEHDYAVTTVEPTENEEGYTLHECQHCGNKFKTDIVKPLSLQEKIVVSSEKATANHDVAVTISVLNNPGIVGARLKVHYDSDVMKLKSVSDGGILGEVHHSDNLGAEPYVLLWMNATEETDFCEDGVLATLTFTVDENAALGDYDVFVTYEPEEIFNKTTEKVFFKTEKGTVSVMEFLCGDADSDGKVSLLDCVYLLRYLAHWKDYKTINSDAADVNIDGSVDMLDAMILLNYFAEAKGYETLPHISGDD